MKKIYSVILISILITSQLFAQSSGKLVTKKQQKKLQELTSTFQRKAIENRKKAFKLAKINNWDTLTISKTGKIRSLQGVYKNGRPKYYTTFNNSTAAGTARTNSFYQNGSLGLNLNGSSSNMDGKMGIWDSGLVRINHQELINRVVIKDDAATLDEHATHVAGTMIAKGVNPDAKGMAWGAKKLQAYDFNTDIPEMTAAADKLLISNHSYGTDAGWMYNDIEGANRWEWLSTVGQNEDANFGIYNEDASNMDEICYNAPYYLPVLAAGNTRSVNGPAVGEPYYAFDNNTQSVQLVGNRPEGMSSNDGFDILTGSTCSKNTLAVGAVNGLPDGSSGSSDIVISDFSSWGPTDDGRIKPDLVGNGVDVKSCSEVSNTSYATLSGTSMASPSVSGSLLLLQEYYATLNNGNFMQASTLKGLALHTTDEAGLNPGPDYIFGWGLLNMERAGNLIKNNGKSTYIVEKNLSNGASFSKTFTSSLTEPVKITICWTDYKAELLIPSLNNRKPSLVNDLDIRLVESGSTYLPWKLNPVKPADAATKGDNIVDNVEQIDTDEQPIGNKTFTLTISHKGRLFNNSQNYSLIISGIKVGSLPLELVRFSASQHNNASHLKWQTLSEQNTSRFEIQRSTDGVNFITIGTKTAAGNSSIVKDYFYNDLSPLFGVNYYHIKTFDVDGTFYTSSVKTVDFSLDAKNSISIYPNPVKEELNIIYNQKVNKAFGIVLYDAGGKKLKSVENIKTQNFKINVGTLPNGIYFIEIKDNNSKSVGVKKFIKE